MELRHDDPFRPVDDKGAAGGHVGDHAQVNILDDRFKIFVFGIGAVKLQLSFQGYAVGEAPFDALIHGVAGRIDKIIQEFEDEVITGIGNRKILGKYLVQALVDPVLRIGFQLEKILERLELNIEKVGIFCLDPSGCETDAIGFF